MYLTESDELVSDDYGETSCSDTFVPSLPLARMLDVWVLLPRLEFDSTVF